MLTIRPDEPLAVAVTEAIHTGNVDALKQMLRENPELATARIGDKDACAGGPMSRTLLHVATDWPGHFPNGAATVAALVEAGADVNARFTGPHTETPLHWAASSDDVEVLDALLDAGADIEASGAVIAGGTPLSDAVAFGQWNTARRLVARGAKTPLREAAALGLMDRVERRWSGAAPPTPDEVTQAFWYACHGGQQRAAAYLLERGAQLNWVSRWDQLTPLDAARRSGHAQVVEWLCLCGAKSASELR
ncbi:MAG: ankyrin repeat domain-containing protein, partial [Vicinamibacteraceae bacterium]